jgi:hypothetical protein
MLYSEPFDARKVNDSLFENVCKDFTADVTVVFPGVLLGWVRLRMCGASDSTPLVSYYYVVLTPILDVN